MQATHGAPGRPKQQARGVECHPGGVQDLATLAQLKDAGHKVRAPKLDLCVESQNIGRGEVWETLGCCRSCIMKLTPGGGLCAVPLFRELVTGWQKLDPGSLILVNSRPSRVHLGWCGLAFLHLEAQFNSSVC